jgi:hypothetical protein
MATALDIILGSLRRLGVLGSGQSPTSSETADALEALNDMGASFDARNVYTGWSPLVLTDDVILEDRHHEALKYMLAERLADDYGMDVSANIKKRAYEGWLLICADYMAPENLRVDDGLAVAHRRHWMG